MGCSLEGAARFCARRPLPASVRAGYLAPYDSWRNRIAVLRFVQDIPLRPGDPAYNLVSEVQDGLHRFRRRPMLVCLNKPDEFILAICRIDGDNMEIRHVRKPFVREPDFGAPSIHYDLPELWPQGTPPA